MTSLSQIVLDAKQDAVATAQKLTPFMQDIFPQLDIVSCAINTGSKVSLNSVNGVLTTQSGIEYFFKFHAEEGEQQSLISAEYYRAQALAEQGWPVVEPIAVSTQTGKQCVVYPKLSAATAYDLYGAQDALFLKNGAYDNAQVDVLLSAEAEYLKTSTQIVLKTLQAGTPDNANASLHQLFSHRLHSVGGTSPRVDLFYTHHPVTLPDGSLMNFDELAAKKFVINGTEFPFTLGDIIAQSKKLLDKDAMAGHPSCISHGDDHNGNKFLIDQKFVAFDPAFAGRHPVLLGLIKGLMHNAPLHPFWYYEPERVHDRLQVTFKITRDAIHITHNGADVLRSPIRDAVMDLHITHVWQPVLRHLRAQNMLPDNFENFVRCAAFCCPFLALNMIKADRHPSPQLSLFNLAQCVQVFHHPAFGKMI